MKRYSFVLIMIVGLMIGKAWSATPVITNWNSTGGETTRDGLQDIMYLVTQGDDLTFTVTVDQTVDYEWQVNKSSETSVNSNTFNWTAPSEGGIWEIHLKCWNGSNEEAHMEWVVSTLTEEEAPDFFDYFTDKKSHERTERDPWDRLLPEWGYSSPPPCPFGFAENWAYSFVDSSVSYGTWKFKYRFPSGNTGAWGFDFSYIIDSSVSGYHYADYSKCADAHHHCCICFGSDGQFSIDYDGAGVYEDGNWHTVTIIRTEEGWFYMWRDDCFELYAFDDTQVNCKSMWLRLSEHEGDKLYFDSIEIYKGDYLFPKKEITYGEYIWNYYCQNYYYYPEKREGIIIKGRNVTLSDIAEAISISHPSLFTYNAGTAICYTDLVVGEGSELIINNETLKFHCNSDGELHFVPKHGSRIDIKDSTLTSDTPYYWVWNSAGSTTHYGNEVLLTGAGHSISETALYGTWPLGHAYHGSLIIKNSKIENTAHMFFDSPYELDIIDTKITGLHEIDIGNYKVTGSYSNALREQREFAKGDKAFWIYTDDVNLMDFKLKNVTISGKTSPINVAFLVNAHRDKLNVYNLDLENENILIKESLAQTHGQSHTCYSNGAPYNWKSYIKSGIGLVNCKFKDLIIAPGTFTDCEGNPVDKFALVKYYLDVIVLDNENNPVPGATVTVTNEIDNNNFPSENMEVLKPYALGEYSCFYHHFRIIDGQPINSCITGPSGHTSLPSEDPSNSFIITDYKKVETDLLEGIRISWKLNSTHWWLLCFDVYDGDHGEVIHRYKEIPYSVFTESDTHHVKLTYNTMNNSVQLVVKNQEEVLIWDSGELKIDTRSFPFQFDQIGFRVRQAPYATKEISWNNQGYLKLYTSVYRGTIESQIDNMKIDVTGFGVIENNDYSVDPGLLSIAEDGHEYYNLSQSTKGNSFTWEFDGKFTTLKPDGPWVSVELRASNTIESESKNINYTYNVTAQKDTLTGNLSLVDPDKSWYREDPNMPTKTVVIVLGGQSYISDDSLKPALSIITPQDGAKVFGRVPIKINATDNFGVIKIELYINDVLTYTFYTSPYEWVWDTKEIPEGEYRIKAVAYDTNDNSSEEEITVKVIKVEGIITYPNPYVKGKSSIERISFANLPKETTIRIYTVSGELVKVIKHKDIADGGSKEWDISGIASGIYMYCIESSEGMKKGKVSIIK